MDFILNQNNLYIVLIALASGAMLLWPVINKSRGGPVGVQQAVQLANQKHGVFLDVRTAELFKTGSIAQARNVPAAELEAKLDTLPKNKPIIVFCDQGRESARAAGILRKQGFPEAVSLEGGLRNWVQAGLPLSKKT